MRPLYRSLCVLAPSFALLGACGGAERTTGFTRIEGPPPADERGANLAPFSLACGTARECIAWSGDGKTLFAQGMVDGKYGLFAVEAETGTARRFGNVGYYGAMHALPDNSTLIATLHAGNWFTLSAVSTADGSLTQLAPAVGRAFAVSDDGKRIAYTSYDGFTPGDTLVVIDYPSLTRIASTFVSGFFGFVLSGDGSSLLITSWPGTGSAGPSQAFTVWTIATGAKVSHQLGTPAWKVGWSRGKFRSVARSDDRLAMLEYAVDGTDTTTYRTPLGPIADFAWVPAEQAMIVAAQGHCYAQFPPNCTYQYEVARVTPTGSTRYGSINGFGFIQFTAPPTGAWLVHQEAMTSPAYLMRRP